MNTINITDVNDNNLKLTINIQSISKEFNAKMCIGAHGELIIISDPDVILNIVVISDATNSYENIPFITLSKNDAKNILDMLNEAICRLESGKRTDNDVEVFGDKAISYERLIDILDGIIYHKTTDTILKGKYKWKSYNGIVKEEK